MALICSACGTENRAVAKFCIECIGVLQPDFEPTKVVPLRPSGERSTTLLGMPSALAAFASSAPASAPAFVSASASAPTPVAAAVKSPDRPEPRKGLWLSLAAFALTLVIGAGGWVVAGAGGWYIYSSSSPAEGAALPVAPAAAAAPVAAAPVATALVAAAPVTPVAMAPAAIAPAATAPITMAAPAVAAPAVAAPAVGPVARMAPHARAAPAQEVAAAAPGLAAPRSKPRVAASGDPGTLCASLGFIARSQCMAAQCAKSAYRAQPACRAVIAQQQLMEEKRNPTLAN